MKGGQTKSEATSTDQRLKTRGRKKKTTTNKDPNKPKRPPSAFFVFLDDFRREFNEAITNLCTNNLISQVGKAAGAKWKSMSEEEKAPYASKAESRKSEYLKSMQHESVRVRASGTNRGEDDESKSEVDEAGGSDEVLILYF
ncbi:unnamed protein product [Brassica oleracea]